MARTLARDVARARRWVEEMLHDLADRLQLDRHVDAARRRLEPAVDAARRVGWRRFLLAAGVLSLVVAAVPPLRWPATRVVAGAVGQAVRPLTPGGGSLEALDTTSRVLDHRGKFVADLHEGTRRDWVTVDELPEHVVRAVLAAEDRNYFSHPGVDPTAIIRAGWAQLRGGDQGGSTITQQLAKLNYTGSETTVLRKAREVLYAARLEREFSKQELLERYVNQVYFGDGAYGLTEAAETFFGVAARDLTPAQAATLAGKIRSPDGLDPHERPAAVVERRNQVLSLMGKEGWLDDDAAAAAREAPLEVRPQTPPQPSLAPWFVEYVKREAAHIEALGSDPASRVHRLLTGGFTVETTLDVDATQAAHAALGEHLADPDDPTGAVVSVVPGDGAIRILVGGRDFSGQKFDAATQAERQPGSAFKPFVYLTALSEGVDPRSQFLGASTMDFDHDGVDFEVSNYGHRGYGMLDLESALVRSVNTIFVQLALEVGPVDIVETVQQAGIDREIEPVPAISLGGINPGVTPLDMAKAFAVFAARGELAEPYAIERIVDRHGAVVYERPGASPDRRFPAPAVDVLNRGLLRVVEWGTGRGAGLPDRDVAGKTGTTSDSRDAWFVGFTPELATAVWVGHLDNAPMPGMTGGSIPALVFQAAMAAALQDVPPSEIPTLDPSELDLDRLPPPRRPPPPPEPDTTTSSEPTTTTTTAPEPEPEPPPTSSSSTSTSSSTSSSTTTQPDEGKGQPDKD